MTEFDLTDIEVQIISLCLLYCSGLIEVDSKFAKECKQENITIDDITQLEKKISSREIKDDKHNHHYIKTANSVAAQ
jgi:hypothetical protein